MVFKDASKAYQASKNAKRAKAGTAIPDWYEPTDKGLRFLPGVLAKDKESIKGRYTPEVRQQMSEHMKQLRKERGKAWRKEK